MPRRPPWRARPAPSPSPPASAAPAGASCSCPSWSLVDLPGVERRLHERDDVLLARGALRVALAHGEGERQLVAGDLVEDLGKECCVLRLLRQVAVEGGCGRKLDHEP